MRTRPVVLCFICTALFMLLAMVGCTTPMEKNSPIAATPVLEQYEYKQREKVCFFPSFTNENEKAEIEKTIACIKGMLVRTKGEPDWNDVADVARSIQMDQEADAYHFDALKHTAINRDWYEVIYEMLNFKSDSRVLDLGCGFGKLWRNNQKSMPQNMQVDAVDVKGSWAEDFERYNLKLYDLEGSTLCNTNGLLYKSA